MDEFGRYFKLSPTDLIRRHLTIASTSTDEFTDGNIPSVFSISPTDVTTDIVRW
jgi:hypothetical protein